MKSTLLVLLALLIAPAVAAPDRNISTCDTRLIVHDGRGVEGEDVGSQTVELVIPCVSKMDLAKVLTDLAASARLNPDEVRAVRNGKNVRLALSTGLLIRSTK